ncbi:GNAT family N-acetyltransferase [Ruegeria sp. EL01]|jgi:RimJ/RimL family protein N-acetyltransferase|uniref:GNAT family N-acetyltransferase n=1 Tax=Ruegeria sp. EL01 TaxID=2107578 RepID=UPI000EA80F61|nr:GNAT family N-acetyltransferase [Ruegeria sp. EL01]
MKQTANEHEQPVMLRSLRPISDQDGSAIHSALQDPDLVFWLAALPLEVDRDTSQKYLDFLLDPEVEASAICLGNRLAGTISLGVELSFWLLPRFHGRGLGRWAVETFIQDLPASYDDITACCMLDNYAASSVLKSNGFQRDASTLRRFSFAHEHSVPMWRYKLNRSNLS